MPDLQPHLKEVYSHLSILNLGVGDFPTGNKKPPAKEACLFLGGGWLQHRDTHPRHIFTIMLKHLDISLPCLRFYCISCFWVKVIRLP